MSYHSVLESDGQLRHALFVPVCYSSSLFIPSLSRQPFAMENLLLSRFVVIGRYDIGLAEVIEGGNLSLPGGRWGDRLWRT